METRMMIKPLSPQKRLQIREMLRRLDAAAANLNVLLVVIAMGLAMLDFTFLVTQRVIDNLPPITRLSDTQSPGLAP
jgi:hypothetical protein